MKTHFPPDPVQVERWMAALVCVEVFVADTGDLPRISRTKSPAELSLYRWVLTQRRRGLSPRYRAILDDRIPGWDNPVYLWAGVFERQAQELKVYRDAYGTWPSARSTDEAVSTLARWVNEARMAARAGTLRPQRLALLDTQVPGWNDTIAQTWERTAHEIAEFLSRTGGMPSSVSPEHSERRLARWMDDKRRGRNMTAERDALLTNILPDWKSPDPMRGVRRHWERHAAAQVQAQARAA